MKHCKTIHVCVYIEIDVSISTCYPELINYRCTHEGKMPSLAS